jgi:hypothetical protein
VNFARGVDDAHLHGIVVDAVDEVSLGEAK